MLNAKLSLLISGAVAAAALSGAPAAFADSIVFVKDGNVWSARPDGSGRVQLTDGGDWHDPSQADDGTIAAVKGLDTIYVMARDGRPLHTMTTPFGVRSGDGGTFSNRPVDLALSPDGRRLAYSYLAYSCPPGSTCGTIQRATFFTETARTVADQSYGVVLGVNAPSWVTSDRVMAFGGYLRNVTFQDLGAAGPASEKVWFSNEEDTKDGELSPDHRFLALDLSYGANTQLGIVPVTGDPSTGVPTKPTQVPCYFGPDAKLGGASWSPDGNGLAFVSRDGIQVARFTGAGPDSCMLVGGSTTDFEPAGSQPDWGPADPPTTRYAAVTTPAAPPTPAVDGGGGATGSLSAGIGGSGHVKLRAGHMSVQCTAPGAARCSVQVAAKLAGHSVRASGAGAPGKIDVHFGKSSARRLRTALRRRPVTATVTVMATAADGRTANATRKLTLRR